MSPPHLICQTWFCSDSDMCMGCQWSWHSVSFFFFIGPEVFYARSQPKMHQFTSFHLQPKSFSRMRMWNIHHSVNMLISRSLCYCRSDRNAKKHHKQEFKNKTKKQLSTFRYTQTHTDTHTH